MLRQYCQVYNFILHINVYFFFFLFCFLIFFFNIITFNAYFILSKNVINCFINILFVDFLFITIVSCNITIFLLDLDLFLRILCSQPLVFLKNFKTLILQSLTINPILIGKITAVLTYK